MTIISEEETSLIRNNNNNAMMVHGGLTLSPTGVIGVRDAQHGAYFELAGFLPCGTLFIQHAGVSYRTERVHRPLVLGTAARLDTHTLNETLRDVLYVLTSLHVPAWAGYIDDVEFFAVQGPHGLHPHRLHQHRKHPLCRAAAHRHAREALGAVKMCRSKRAFGARVSLPTHSAVNAQSDCASTRNAHAS